MQLPANFRPDKVTEPLHLLDRRLHRRQQLQGIVGLTAQCPQFLDQAGLTLQTRPGLRDE